MKMKQHKDTTMNDTPRTAACVMAGETPSAEARAVFEAAGFGDYLTRFTMASATVEPELRYAIPRLRQRGTSRARRAAPARRRTSRSCAASGDPDLPSDLAGARSVLKLRANRRGGHVGTSQPDRGGWLLAVRGRVRRGAA